MEFIDILNIIYQCSLTEKPRTDFMIELIDNMMIEGAKNPFENSLTDTMNRIFLGTNSFPRIKAKYIYSHKDEHRLSSYIHKMGDQVVLNIETEIQKNDDSYEQDESCFKLSEMIFESLYKISNKPRAIKAREHTALAGETAPQPVQEQNNAQETIGVEKEIVFQQAQAFCIEYEEYIELLPLCQIASSVNQFHKYVRQMYTDYCKCSTAVRIKILEINDCRILDFPDKDWIEKCVCLFDKVIHERKLCTVSFLYDGAKYFHRAFERYADYPVECDPWIFKRLIKFESPLLRTELKCNLYRYIADYFELLKDNPEIDNVPPLDAMWAYCRDENIPESEVTYWVCMSMIAACPQLGDESTYDNDLFYVDLGDSEGLINTQEDMYLYALLELYKMYYITNDVS
jgi:hypothetical protein